MDDNFLVTPEVELDPTELSDTESVSPKPTFIPSPNKDDASKQYDLIRSTVMSMKSIGSAKCPKPIFALFDSGGSDIMINRNAIPKSAIEMIDTKKSFSTTAGDLHTMATVQFDKIYLPEFSHVRHTGSYKAYVFEDPQKKVPYDIILGRNFLNGISIQLDFASSATTWLDNTVPMRPHGYWNDTQRLHDALSLDPSTVKVSDSYAAHPRVAIADAKHEKADIPSVMAIIDYLTVQEGNDLYWVLLVNEDLFSGKLGCYPNKVFSLKLRPDAKPFHSKQSTSSLSHGPFNAMKMGLYCCRQQGSM
jgi:hypothetical protein